MKKTSTLYNELFDLYLNDNSNVYFETRLSVDGNAYLINEEGFNITFGGYRIIVEEGSNPDSGFSDEYLISMRSSSNLFSDVTHLIGECVSSFIEIEMLKPVRNIKRNSKIIPYVRLTDGVNHSEWIQKGVFYIDTRQEKDTGSGAVRLTLRAYDAMLKAEQDYPWDRLSWPTTDTAVVRDICYYLGIDLDSRTSAIMTKGYSVQLPAQYSCREILGYIAAMYGGNFVMSDLGKLLLVQMGTAPSDTVDIGRRMRSFSSSEALSSYDRVELLVDDDNAYYAGSNTGRTLTVECPWGTQAVANALLTQFQSFRYQPFRAENAIFDPAAELGDGIIANGVTSGIYTMDITFGTGFRGTLTAPWEEELDHEYPYVPKQDRKIRRQLHGLTTELTVQAGLIQGEITDRINEVDILESRITQNANSITAEVSARKSDVSSLSSKITQSAESISAKVSKSGGSSSSFGWSLTDSSWTLTSNGSTVLKADSSGVEITGKITAKSGKIGDFSIVDDSLTTNGQTWGGDLSSGIYIGYYGIQLGDSFSVDRYGRLQATDGRFTGTVWAQMIAYDDDAGYFSGDGLETYSVGGWWGNDRIDYDTISTPNLVDSINESLANADWAAGVLSGAEAFETVSALHMYTDVFNVSNEFYFGGYELYLGSFIDGNGNVQRCVQWYS